MKRKRAVENLKILIIEDDADQRDLLKETLEDHFGRGTVHEAATGREALAAELARYDLILCDYNLPDASGMDVLDEILRRCDTPVIMVTGENVGQTAAEAIRRGATDYVVKTGEYLFTIPLVVEKSLTLAKVKKENEELRRRVEQALNELKIKNEQLEQSLRRVEEVAATDPLTGLYNRRHFGKLLDQLLAEAQRYDKDLSCVMIDVDCFKQLNDAYGHQTGDQLLVMAGKVIQANMRRMDVAARYGGDEFILLLPHATADEAAAVATRIRDEYARATSGILAGRPVTLSIGIATLRGQRHAGGEELVGQADAALYRAKQAGRNRIVAGPASEAIPHL